MGQAVAEQMKLAQVQVPAPQIQPQNTNMTGNANQTQTNLIECCVPTADQNNIGQDSSRELRTTPANHRTVEQVKSHSDTTIYAPGLLRLPNAQVNGIVQSRHVDRNSQIQPNFVNEVNHDNEQVK